MGLDQKKALVTGGTRGIGKAIVKRLIAEGAEVVYCGRSDPCGARPENPAAMFIKSDVSDPEQVQELVARTSNLLGGLDILINNAGVELEKNLVETTETEWDWLMNINLKGVFLCCKYAIPTMTCGGSIVNLGSISASVSDPGLAAYNASKAAVCSLSRSIAVDFGEQGIRCNTVCPGWIDTDMLEQTFSVARDTGAARQDALRRHPVGRLGIVDDIASTVAWLCSSDASFISGQVITVDGGLTASTPVNPHYF